MDELEKRYSYNTKAAFECYLRATSLDNKDITAIFGFHSSSKISQIKGEVRRKMAEIGLYLPNFRIDVGVAFEVWGIDVGELEKKYNKLRKYGL